MNSAAVVLAALRSLPSSSMPFLALRAWPGSVVRVRVRARVRVRVRGHRRARLNNLEAALREEAPHLERALEGGALRLGEPALLHRVAGVGRLILRPVADDVAARHRKPKWQVVSSEQ
eukprot:scaffold1229_cov60-Phaeocystis_antarctica.AAC.7